MRVHSKHLHLARRKMARILDEIYTALLHYGSDDVRMRIVKEEEGLRLFVQSDFDPSHRDELRRMGELLQPAVKSPAMVEEFWELAGEDPYTSESEMALIGQMADAIAFTLRETAVEIEVWVQY